MVKGRYVNGGQSRYGNQELMTCGFYKKAKCAECGKRFMRTNDHAYKRRDPDVKWYCSYTCFRVKAKEDERKAREKTENALRALDSKEAITREYNQRKRESKSAGGDRIICRSLTDAQVRLEGAEKKIKQYEREYLLAKPGTSERAYARRSITRWEKKHKNLLEEVAFFEEKEKGEQNV